MLWARWRLPIATRHFGVCAREHGTPEAPEHLPQLHDFASEWLPPLVAYQAAVVGELKLVVELGGGLDADVEVPREFFPRCGCAPFNNVVWNGVQSATHLRFELRIAALRNGGDGDMRIEHERVGALPHEEATEILHAITLHAVTLRFAIDRPHTGTINCTQQTP